MQVKHLEQEEVKEGSPEFEARKKLKAQEEEGQLTDNTLNNKGDVTTSDKIIF